MGKIRPEHFPVSSSVVGHLVMSAFNKEERMFGIKAKREIRDIINEFNPQAYWLHTITWSPNIFELAMRAAKRGVKVVTYHTLVEQYGRLYGGNFGAWVMRNRSRSVCNNADRVIVPSQVIAEKLVNYGVTKPLSVIPTGVSIPQDGYNRSELSKRFGFPEEAALLLYVGRISKEKNILALLKLTAELNRRGKLAVLLMIGPGDIEETLLETAKFKLADRVICSGALPKLDTQRCYGAADVFVFASNTETQGLVIGEAMLAGTPVVALDSPIRPEIYPEEVAIVVKNEVDFAPAVLNLLADKKRRQLIARKAQRFVQQNFSIETMIERQLAMFEEVVHAAGFEPTTFSV